jgi:hypothetical protein
MVRDDFVVDARPALQDEHLGTSAALETTIQRASEQIANRLAGRCAALLLVGAAARGEVTLGPDGALLSDLDFLVVLPQRNLLGAIVEERRCREQLCGLESKLAHAAPDGVSIGFANAAPRYWSVATPLMWELRTCARVLHGRAEVREWPAIRYADQIPQWEGIRLVANRLCELFGLLGILYHNTAARPLDRSVRELRYACVKLMLACSEAQLIDRGVYQATYRDRWQMHQHVAMRFGAAQNEVIDAAYCVKVNSDAHRLAADTWALVSDALGLAITTFAWFGLQTPAALAARVLHERPAAPGMATDIAFFVVQRVHGTHVPLRRAIAAVYARAFSVAQRLADAGPLQIDQALLDECRQIARSYKLAPQMVSVIGTGARA